MAVVDFRKWRRVMNGNRRDGTGAEVGCEGVFMAVELIGKCPAFLCVRPFSAVESKGAVMGCQRMEGRA